MKIIAINGSARKNGNTHILLSKVIEGAQSVGA
jgi:multimeric flavodoxin WrbA